MADTKISAATLRTPAAGDMVPLAVSGSTTAYRAYLQPSTTSAAGLVELATAAETRAGTSTALAVTPNDLLSVAQSVYNVKSSEYGALGNGSTDDRAAIQAAINAAYAAGGGVVYFPPSATAYMLNAASGEHPFRTGKKYCLQIYSNVHLCVPTGATLKLSDAQMTDAGGYVDMIVAEDASNLMVYGGGRITGNTAGQTGWTSGYGSTGSLIAVFANSAISDLRFYDLQLDDHFGEALQIDAATRIIKRVWIENLYIDNCGGGVYCNRIDQVSVKNCYLPDTTDVMEQDGIEISNSINFSCAGCYVDNSSTGNSCFELYGSTRGVLGDFVAIGLSPISDVPLAGGIDDPADLIIRDGYIIGTDKTSASCIGIALGGVTACTGRISNVKIKTCYYGIMLSASDNAVAGPFTIDCCDISDIGAMGILPKMITELSIIGGHIDDCTNYAIHVTGDTAGSHNGLTITGLEGHGSAAGIVVASNCGSYGAITGCNLYNSGGPIGFSYEDTSKNFIVANNYPDYASLAIVYAVTPYRVFDPTDASIATFLRPSYYQELLVKITRSQTFVDKTQSGGNNLKLAGSANFVAAAGNYLCLQFDGADWVELWRRA